MYEPARVRFLPPSLLLSSSSGLRSPDAELEGGNARPADSRSRSPMRERKLLPFDRSCATSPLPPMLLFWLSGGGRATRGRASRSRSRSLSRGSGGCSRFQSRSRSRSVRSMRSLSTRSRASEGLRTPSGAPPEVIARGAEGVEGGRVFADAGPSGMRLSPSWEKISRYGYTEECGRETHLGIN